MNELPLRGVMTAFNVTTRGPNLHAGPIGELLISVNSIRIVLNFPRITLNDEFVDVLNRSLDLSSDQKYLRDILIIISTGIIPVNFENRSPGKIGYARWLTTANRVLRLYITCISPSDDLCIIKSYIVNVYARMWFNIKYKSTLKYGAIHLYNLICYSRSLSNDTIDCCIKHTLLSRIMPTLLIVKIYYLQC